MVIPGWMRSESPFHAGELAIQSRLNVQAQIDRQGRQIIREYLPEQFRQFFAQLPYGIVGTVDAMGNPWASILIGEPGFLSIPDDYSLKVDARPLLGDPLTTTLASGIDIGFLIKDNKFFRYFKSDVLFMRPTNKSVNLESSTLNMLAST